MKKKKAKPKKVKKIEPSDLAQIKEYFFAFEMVKQYPYTRSYIIKQPLKKSFKETLGELFVGRNR